tara:strand:+ start:72 stop:242 length:171 start_codon:yes stop_codon:yes gene_type:complete
MGRATPARALPVAILPEFEMKFLREIGEGKVLFSFFIIFAGRSDEGKWFIGNESFD